MRDIKIIWEIVGELSEIAGADFFVHTELPSYISNMFREYDANCVTMENGTAIDYKTRIILSL